MKFWKKKDKAQGRGDELRRFYRRAPGKKHALSVQIRREQTTSLNGELADVSAGGAGVSFAAAHDPELSPGAGTVLVFSSLGRSGQVFAMSRVVSATPVADGTRYGFEFVDLPGLFQQLDEYYVRFFNRRRLVRVRPGLDQKIEVRLSTQAGSSLGRLQDFSTDGVGIALDTEQASTLPDADALEVQFVIPKSRVEIRWAARAVHLTNAKAGAVLGGEFAPEPCAELESQRKALADYAEVRAAEMARWDSGHN